MLNKEFADACRLHFPQNREVDIDDILVAGEHQALLRYVAYGCAAAPDIVHDSHADIDLVHAQRFGREHRFNGIWQMVVQAGLHLAYCLAEAQHHTEFVRLDPEKARKTPERKHAKHHESETASAEIAAGQHAPQFVLAATEDFFEIWRRRARRLRSRAPGALAARAPGPPPP